MFSSLLSFISLHSGCIVSTRGLWSLQPDQGPRRSSHPADGTICWAASAAAGLRKLHSGGLMRKDAAAHNSVWSSCDGGNAVRFIYRPRHRDKFESQRKSGSSQSSRLVKSTGKSTSHVSGVFKLSLKFQLIEVEWSLSLFIHKSQVSTD